MTISANLYGMAGLTSTASLGIQPIVTIREPETTDVMGPAGPFRVGQLWVNSTSDSSYQLTSIHSLGGVVSATWSLLGAQAGVLDTLEGDVGGTVSPSAGNIDLLGTAGQIVTTGSGSQIVFSLDSPLTPGDVAITGTLSSTGATTLATTGASVNTFGNATGATSVALVSGTGGISLTSTGTGDITVSSTDTLLLDSAGVLEINSSAGVISIGNDAVSQNINLGTAGTRTLVIGSATATETVLGTFNLNTTGSAVTTIGTGGTGALALGNATGNTAVTGSLAATTTLTATLGNVTATNGNFVSSATGKGLLFNATTATGVAASPIVLNARAGSAVFTSVSIAAAADLTLTITNSAITGATTQVVYAMYGATTGSALSIKSVTNTAGSSAVVVTNGTGATTTTADINLTFLVVN